MNNNDNQNQTPVAPADQDLAVNTTVLAVQNNPVNNKAQLDYQQQQLEEKQMSATLTELGQSSFEQLVDKYTLSRLCNLVLEPGPITYYSVVDRLVVNRQLLVTNFIKPEAMSSISEKTKDDILTLLAALKADETTANISMFLTQINPNLILPENFQVSVYQPRAYELWQASENIKKTIVDATYNEYLGDVLKLIFLPDEQYQNLSAKVENLAKEIKDSYTHPKSEEPTPQTLTDEILKIFVDFGRTPIFIEETKEKNVFGNMVELFSKIEFAVTVTNAIKAKKLPQPLSSETIASETKIFMIQNTVLK